MSKKRNKNAVDPSQPARVLGMLEKAREQYATSWSQDALAFEADGHYAWMCNIIDSFDRVLEVGCGDGRSTMEIARRNHRIISIDENPACLKTASERLANNGYSSKVIYRGAQKGKMRSYDMVYSPLDIEVPNEQILLIESDLFADKNIEDWLLHVGPVDAVVCWLIGTYDGRQGQQAFAHVKSPGDYRLTIQNRLYELSDLILRPGGRLHIVDRGEEIASQELLNDTIESHKEQASVTSLVVSHQVESRLYKPAGGVDTFITKGISGRMPEAINIALVSIFSEKPMG